ncbi:DUF2461 domain-containing protein [Haliangium sp.]|uniref:DUF2461 domain-containing protein n=1 Tax=Haliangium sp. TaxID=2663208 RepID=UPI003D0A9CFD
MSVESMFTAQTLSFLQELEVHNERDWFEANRHRYEAEVRAPARAFIRAMGPRLAEISPHIVADDRKSGGSLLRIHRDTRFARDKRPYKTNVGIRFRHSAGKDTPAPWLYVHISPEESFVGVGLWHPDADTLRRIRTHIVAHPKAWVRARDEAGFQARFELGGDSLSRAPRGFDADHALVEDLKRKDHIASARLSLGELLDPGLVEQVSARFAAARPYLAFLNAALDLPF